MTLLKSFVNRKQNGELPGIHSVERFRSILEYERNRSVRSSQMLSLVVFNVGRSNTKSNGNGHLARALAVRIRSIDEVGWLDNQHIGVLLPYTSTTGARKLAEDACQSIATEVPPPLCTVYTYPASWFFDNNGHSVQFNLPNISIEKKITTSQEFSISAKYTGRNDTNFAIKHSHQSKGTQKNAVLPENTDTVSLHPLPVWKRTMDIIGSSLGLIVLSPIMLLSVVIIKIVSPGPAFFKQQRIGYMGKPFTLLKFRTMKVNADVATHQQYLAELINGCSKNNRSSAKPMIKLDGELQIILFGRILRQTCLDELPQLINVLRGEMTLVGPRPPIPYEVKEYLPWHKGRIDVVPGMTGLWQVSGKNRLTFNEMVCLDIQYWRKKSMWLDIKILLMTPIVILSQIKDSIHRKNL